MGLTTWAYTEGRGERGRYMGVSNVALDDYFEVAYCGVLRQAIRIIIVLTVN